MEFSGRVTEQTLLSDLQPVLWRTKLHRPQVTPTLIQRPRLLEQLNRGLHHRLILVCAPAGFGKTTLLSSWIEEMETGGRAESVQLPAAWLTLQASESGLADFVRYLIAATRTIFDDACPETNAMVFGAQLPPPRRIAASLSNELDRLPGQILLVLDDYHTIRGKAVPKLLNRLLNHWPAPLHLALISRTNPPLQLAGLRAADRLTEIRSRDLRFRRDEAGQFLGKTLQMPLSDTLLDQFEAKTEGWIGALRLAALSMRAGSGVVEKLALFEHSDATMVEYLINDVLLQQFPVIQDFLLKTSVLERFSAPLCAALMGDIDPAWSVEGCIDWLERQELFIIPLDERREWFRYHYLLLDVLRLRLSATLTPEQVRELHRRAAEWYGQEGLIDDALRHARLAEDNDLVVEIMERALRDALNRSPWQVMDEWLRQLPAELIHSQPRLLMIKAWTLHFSWQLQEMSDCLDEVEALIAADSGQTLDGDGLRLLRAQMAAMRAQKAYFDNRPGDAVSFARQAEELAPASWTFLRGAGIFYSSVGMQAAGEGPAAERMLLDAYASLEDKTNSFAMRLLLGFLVIYFSQGDFEKLRQMAEVMLNQAIRGRAPLSQAWARFFLGAVYYQWNELDSAAGQFERVVADGYLAHQICIENSKYGLALIYQARGRSDEANRLVEQIAAVDIGRVGYVEEDTLSLQARLALQQGRPGSAYRWADAFTAPPADRPLLWLELTHVTRARVLLARGGADDVAKALRILDSLCEIAERTHNTRSKIEILAVRALALAALGQIGAAQKELGQALALSQAGDFVRVFVDEGPAMRRLLSSMNRNGFSGERVQRILAAFPPVESAVNASGARSPAVPEPDSAYPSIAGPLTRRESQVLQYLREPLSIKDIARRQGLSHATVKRHSINIYGKLGVNSRWDAVAVAIELGLLPPR